MGSFVFVVASLLVLPISSFNDTYDTSTLVDPDVIIENKLEPKFKYGDIKGILGCNISFASGQPVGKYTVTWKKNGIDIKDLKNTDHFTVEENKLIIQNPRRSDGGVYVAKFLSTETPAKFPSYECKVNYYADPLVLDFPESWNFEETQDLYIHCNVKAHPTPVITWFKDDKNIMPATPNGTRIKLEPYLDIPNAGIKIIHVNKADAGCYKCHAYSTKFNTSNSKTILIRITDKLAALWPLIGILASATALFLIIFAFEHNARKRIKQEEEKLYRMSFATSAEAIEAFQKR